MGGPACSAAASPVNTKMPVPMMAPIPSVTRLIGPRTRLSECSPVAAASAFSCSIDFVAKIDMNDPFARLGFLGSRLYTQGRDVGPQARFGVAGAEEVADH